MTENIATTKGEATPETLATREEEVIFKRTKIPTRQEFVKMAREACEFGVSEMDALTILTDDAYCRAGLTWEEFAEILTEGGYPPWEAKRRAKSEWETYEKYDLCNKTTAD